MSMVCPQCRGSFEKLSQCPKCGVRLQNPRGERIELAPPSDERWHQTPFGRTLAGLVLAAGLGYGLLQLYVSSLGILHKQPGGLTPQLGLQLFVGLPALAVLVGATLAGVGRSRGVAYGVVVGLLASAFFLFGIRSGAMADLAQPLVGDLLSAGNPKNDVIIAGLPFRMAVLLGMPTAFLFCGFVGGFIGSLIWKPPSELVMPTFNPPDTKPMQELSTSGMYRPLPKPETSLWKGRVAWLRVLAGIGLAFAGALFSRRIIDLITTFGEGTLHIESNYQMMLATREVFGVAMFLGAAVAGATTRNGVKQGFVVGLGAGLLQGVLMASLPQGAESLYWVVLFAAFVGPLGGWFGCKLMPAVPLPK